LILALLAPVAQAAGCGAIARLVDAVPAGPVFIASYPTAGIAALKGTAFVYDNALAVIALLACHDRGRAARIGAALRIAAARDRFWHDGRLRNAYRAGPVRAGEAPALPGWWDDGSRSWAEDPYAVGTATGNVAWAALALVWLGTPADRAAAAGLMRWVMTATATGVPVAGFAGGFFGEEPAPVRLGWASTEHNADAAAVFGLLAGADAGFAAAGARARGFVAAMWDARAGRFWLGTTGGAVNRAGAALDANLWPLIAVADAPAAWGRVKRWVRAHQAVGGGYSFAAPADGVWTEGTAQAALILPDAAALRTAQAQVAPDGLLYATAGGTVRTGLGLSPGSVTDDFRYLHLPHLGATAWAVLAATRTNPFRPE
jgi:hypothetical protein